MIVDTQYHVITSHRRWYDVDLGDNCIQNFHLVGISSDIRAERISDIPLQIKILNMVIPISMQFCSFVLNWSGSPAKSRTSPNVINDVKLFPTVYRRIYCCNFLTLSNQTSRYKIKCLEINVVCLLGTVWDNLFFFYSEHLSHKTWVCLWFYQYL